MNQVIANKPPLCYNDPVQGVDELPISQDSGISGVHPVVAEWVSQLLGSERLTEILRRYGEGQVDVTLSCSRGHAVLQPRITLR